MLAVQRRCWSLTTWWDWPCQRGPGEDAPITDYAPISWKRVSHNVHLWFTCFVQWYEWCKWQQRLVARCSKGETVSNLWFCIFYSGIRIQGRKRRRKWVSVGAKNLNNFWSIHARSNSTFSKSDWRLLKRSPWCRSTQWSEVRGAGHPSVCLIPPIALQEV